MVLEWSLWADPVYATICVRAFFYCTCVSVSVPDGHSVLGRTHRDGGILILSSYQKQPYNRMYAMASDNQWSMFSIALYRRIDIYLFVLYIICRFYKKDLILITSSGIFFYIHYCNELLSKMIKKDRWVLFCYAVIYNSFKKQAFWYDTFPGHWKKTEDLKWHPNWPLDSLLRKKLEIVRISQTKLAQHRPVVLNLFDLWPFKQMVQSSGHSTVGKCVKNNELWFAFSLRGCSD